MAATDASVLEESFASSSSDYSLLGAFSHPLPIEIVISTIVWLMCILAVFGNILIFVAILSDNELRSSVANMYILNLASADLLVGISSLTMKNIWRYTGNWPFQRAVCTFFIIVDYAACTQSPFAVTLISLDRYFMVTKGLEYRKYQNKRIACSLILGTWTLVLFFCAFPILGNELWPNAREIEFDYSITCDFGVLYVLSYNIAQIMVGLVAPVIILTYLNFKVYTTIVKRARNFRRPAVSPMQLVVAQSAAERSANTNSSANTEASTSDTKRIYKRHRKAAATLALIVGVFTLCYTPYFVLQLVMVVEKKDFSWQIWNGVFYAVWVNSAINPFIYAARSPKIRRRFSEVLCFWNRLR